MPDAPADAKPFPARQTPIRPCNCQKPADVETAARGTAIDAEAPGRQAMTAVKI